MTYPHVEVDEFLRERFVAVRLDSTVQAKEAAELIRPGAILWTPLLLFADHRGRVVRQLRGYLAPMDFLGEGKLALGLVALLHRRFDESAALRDEVARSGANRSELAAEALYWAGVAAFRSGGEKALLVPVYRQLVRRFPESLWAVKAWPYVDWNYGRAKLGA